MGSNNPQFAVPVNNAPLINGSAPLGCMPNMHPSAPQPCYFNAPIHILPMQNGQLNMPVPQSAGSAVYSGQFPVGFCPPNSVPNMIPVGMFPMNGLASNLMQNHNLINHSQPTGQIYMHNPTNPGQNFQQNAGFPNRPLFFQNSNQSNYQVPMQVNHGHVAPFSGPPCASQTFGNLNQVTGSMGPQNPPVIANPPVMVHSNQVVRHVNQYHHNSNHGQHIPCNAPRPSFGPNNTLGHPNQAVPPMGPQNAAGIGNPLIDRGQHKLSVCQTDVNALNQSLLFSQRQHVNMPTVPTSGSVHPQQTHKNFQPLVCKGSQAYGLKDGRTNRRMPKSQAQHKRYSNGMSWTSSNNGKKGRMNRKAEKSGTANKIDRISREQKRPISWYYTKQEVQLWREARRRNYPSKVNVDKKLLHKLGGSEINQDAELRRQELKDVLAKQAELGIEVAEIPSYYMLDSDNKRNIKEYKRDLSSKKGRLRNRSKKRERYDHQNGCSAKKRMGNKTDSPNKPYLNQRNPTLLQKLLAADIKRDRIYLLQAFRFLVTNSFLKDWPEKPLTFPSVVARDCEINGMAAGDQFLLMENGALQCSNVVKTGYDSVVSDDRPLLLGKGASQFDDVQTNAQVKEVPHAAAGEMDDNEEGSSEEEGEITD